MKNKIAVESLSMDLLRVALFYHKGADKNAQTFSKEGLKRIDEIEVSQLKPYFAKIIKEITKVLKNPKPELAEDALMYSVLCKNYAKKFLAK